MPGHILITLFILLLITFTAVLPVWQAKKAQSKQRSLRLYRNVKLRAVRRHYPALHKLSDEEILARYNVSAAYENIGR